MPQKTKPEIARVKRNFDNVVFENLQRNIIKGMSFNSKNLISVGEGIPFEVALVSLLF